MVSVFQTKHSWTLYLNYSSVFLTCPKGVIIKIKKSLSLSVTTWFAKVLNLMYTYIRLLGYMPGVPILPWMVMSSSASYRHSVVCGISPSIVLLCSPLFLSYMHILFLFVFLQVLGLHYMFCVVCIVLLYSTPFIIMAVLMAWNFPFHLHPFHLSLRKPHSLKQSETLHVHISEEVITHIIHFTSFQYERFIQVKAQVKSEKQTENKFIKNLWNKKKQKINNYNSLKSLCAFLIYSWSKSRWYIDWCMSWYAYRLFGWM